MFEAVREAVRVLQEAVDALEPGILSGTDAAELHRVFTLGERVCGAGRLAAARRVEASNHWRAEGHRSAASWLAQREGTTLGAAVGALDTAHHLEELPATAEAFRQGRLSESQTKEIAAAASRDPAAEEGLLAAARSRGLGGLRERCRQVKMAACDDEVAAYERVRRSRFLRHWVDSDGAWCLSGRFPLDDGARLAAALEVRAGRIFAEARRAGRREPPGAYQADALIELASCTADSSSAGGPAAMVHIRVDHAAWTRGHTEPGEVCEIPGLGPIPVATARRLANDAILAVLVTDGVEVSAVAHAGRTIPAHLRSALAERDPTCCNPGCEVRHGLEIDHIIPVAEGGPTTLANLARLCKWDHYLKTHHGWKLAGQPGAWTWTPPNTPTPTDPTYDPDITPPSDTPTYTATGTDRGLWTGTGLPTDTGSNGGSGTDTDTGTGSDERSPP